MYVWIFELIKDDNKLALVLQLEKVTSHLKKFLHSALADMCVREGIDSCRNKRDVKRKKKIPMAVSGEIERESALRFFFFKKEQHKMHVQQKQKKNRKWEQNFQTKKKQQISF